jgi:hypothetical protein
VVEVGGGAGSWLTVALDLGTTRVRGYDGGCVQAAALKIPDVSFKACDLTASMPDGLPGEADEPSKFDLVLSLETAARLPASAASGFVAALCRLGDVILFSAAIPHQGGADEINGNWPAYWNALFREHGFECFDAVRPAFWMRSDVEWWYAQNALIFAKGQNQFRERLVPVAEPLPYVHPRKYELQVAQTRELAAALTAATNPHLTPPALDAAAEIARLERAAGALRTLLETKGGALEAELARVRADADATRRELDAIAGSTTWRATAPLRWAVDAGKRLARRLSWTNHRAE